MNTTPVNRQANRRAIRELFAELGGNVSLRQLAKAVADRGLLANRSQNAIQAECRRALLEATADGVPFARPLPSSPTKNRRAQATVVKCN